MAITRSGNRVTILGHKLSGTVTAAGVLPGASNPDENSYLEDTVNMAGNVSNIVESGTADPPCRYNPGSGLRETLHQTGKNFLTNCTYGDIAHQKTDNIYQYIRPFIPDTAHAWCDNIFYDYGENDPYDIYGKQPGDSANYLNIFDSNLIIITSGAGIGQVRSVRLTMPNWVVLNHAWETIPSPGDSYIIAWSPADVVHAFAAAGVINTINNGKQYGLIEIQDDGIVGNGTTETSFGWSGYTVCLTDRYPVSPSWSTLWLRYTNSTLYQGEWSPVARRVIDHAGVLTYASLGNQSNVGGISGTPEAKIYGSVPIQLTSGGIEGTKTESSFTLGIGELSSYRSIGFPITLTSDHDYYKYPGGNWGGPMENMPTLTANAIVVGSVCEYDGSSPATVRGLGWHGSNTGDPGAFFVRWIGADWGIVGKYQLSGIDVDWFWVDSSLTMTSSYFWSKPFNITVKDDTATPIANATVEIRRNGGELVSYVDSGSVINESVNTTEVDIDVTDVENLTTGEQWRIDQEHILAGTVPAGPGNGTVTGCTRENIHDVGYVAALHEQSSLNYDPKIYIISPLTTDAQGATPEQIVDWGYWTKQASEVKHNGVFYTCILKHDSSLVDAEPGIGSVWTTYWSIGGTEAHPWRDDAKYHAGDFSSVVQVGINKWGPFPILIRKYGYHSYTSIIDPSFDIEAVNIDIQLVTDEALGGISEAQAAALPITYDSGTNTVIVGKDGTWFYDDSTACTLLHIYAKSQYENWGIIHRDVDAEQYTLYAKVEIGDGVDAVYFKAEGVQLMFADGIATADNTILFRVKASSVARFGTVLDAGAHYTNQGCAIHLEESTYTVQVRADTSGTLNLYSTKYHQPSGLLRYSNDAWNCHFSGGMSVGVQAPDIDFYNLIIEGTGTGGPSGFTINGGLGNFERISILNVEYGLDLCQCFANEAVMRNLYVRATLGGYHGGPDPGFFVDIVDSDFNTWTNPNLSAMSYGGTIRRIYTVRLRVVDGENNPVASARVILKDKNGATVFVETTDASGDITDTEVVEGTLDYVPDTPGDPITLSPFEFVIEKGGYDRLTKAWTMPINAIDGFRITANLVTQQLKVDLEEALRP